MWTAHDLPMNYRFRPKWIPTLATLLLLPLLVGLGLWQLDRAEQKRALQAEYDRRAQGPGVLVGPELRGLEDLRFHRVVAKGYYEPEHQVLIDNRVHRGQVGYYVITPLRLLNGDARLLVNRGWVPLGADRQRLPPAPAPAGLQEITGVATVPAERVFTLGRPAPGWQPVWQHLDLQRYRSLVAFPVQPVVVLLDSTSGAGGFVREWGRLDAGIATHQGYAFQWFALAVALLTLFLVLNISKTAESDQ